MEWHPYAKLFPMMSDSEVQSLAEDIRENGLRHPIVIDRQERIVDGRNRAAACVLAGVEPVLEPVVMNDREVLSFVISSNLKRRHLTESQRADVAARIANVKVGGDRKSKDQSPNLDSGADSPVTLQDAADMMQVSRASVASAKKVQQKGTPELQQAVANGDVSVSRAARIAELPEREQKQEMKDGRNKPPAFDHGLESARAEKRIRGLFSKWPKLARKSIPSILRTLAAEDVSKW